LAALPLTKAERTDHIPDLLRELATRLENQSFELSPAAAEAARKHGRTRHQQGYTIPQILFETRVLQKILCEFIQENLLNIELSTLVRDILQVGQNLQAELEVSIREYQAQIPRSLQTSFSMLYNSRYLGVAILDDHRITDANDAMLRMIGRTREQVSAGEINWQEMTPEQFRPVDAAAIEQLREFGACAPYEKNFVLPDGSSLPFLIGAVRLTLEPLEWSAYVVDLTEQRRVGAAEQKLRESEAKYTLINQLAHEINNPLAALMFSTHLLGTHPALTDDMRLLLGEIGEMLSRVTDTVRRVLAESQR
jgi:PAS domain S-box-containing protein